MTAILKTRRMPPSFAFFLVIGLALCTPSLHASPAESAPAPRSTATPRKRPAAPGPRAGAIDVKHVALDLRFDWPKQRALGTATITLAPLAPTRRIALDAVRLTIDAITLADGRPLAYRYDDGDRDDGLVITLDRLYPAGAELTVVCTYATNWVNESDPNNIWGSDGKGLRFFAPTFTEPVKRRQIWSMGWPAGNRCWFPGNDAPDDLRTTDLIATVEPPLMAISNGRLVETRTNADGTRSYHWRMDRPYANHLTSFVVGEYVDVPQACGNVALHSFGYPDEAEAVAASVVRLPEMVKFFTEITGVPCPQESYAQVFVQDLPWGWGNAGVATLTENMIDDARTHADWRYLWDGLEAEALAHQWFGCLLTPRDWSEAWLDRGFARYLDGLFNEHANGRAEFLLWQRWGDLSTYLADWQAGLRHPVVTRKPAQAPAFASDNYPSFRGALVLHMLRRQVGDEAFGKAIRHYVASNVGRAVTTGDFRKSVEAACGEPMGWFFDQWIHRMGHPVFEITQDYDAARGRLTLRVRQTQKPDPKAEFPQARYFAGLVDLEIDGTIERVRLLPRALNVFTFARERAPHLVNFDYESAWIKEMTFQKSTDDLLYQLAHDTDVTGRRWAMGELVRHARLETTTAEEKARIQAGFRGLIQGDSYWRLRMLALTQLRGLMAPATATEPLVLDDETRAMLLALIQNEKSWVRAAALGFLGFTRDAQYADLYLEAFHEESHQVIYAAAAALGRSKSPRAYDALTALMDNPSWKGENRLSGLLGLKELGDPRGFDAAFAALADRTSHRWTLATSLWDFRIAGAETIVALGRGAEAYPLVAERFEKSLQENDVNDIFSNLLLIATLADPRGQAAYDTLKARFKDDANALGAVEASEAQFKAALKKP